MSRGSPLLLAFAVSGCFIDTMPGDLSTASGGSTASGAGTTSGGAGSTSDAATTAQATGTTSVTSTTGTTGTTGTTSVTSTTGTGEATTSPATGTTNPETTATTMPEPGSTSSGSGEFDQCAATPDRFFCYACCGGKAPGWDSYLTDIAGCVCGMNECNRPCKGSLCENDPITKACFTCLSPMAGEPCFVSAKESCSKVAGCAPFFECIEAANCDLKPS